MILDIFGHFWTFLDIFGHFWTFLDILAVFSFFTFFPLPKLTSSCHPVAYWTLARQCTGLVTTAGGGSQHDSPILELGRCQLLVGWSDLIGVCSSFEAWHGVATLAIPQVHRVHWSCHGHAMVMPCCTTFCSSVTHEVNAL